MNMQKRIRKFGKKAVERYGWEWFQCQREPKYMGDDFVYEDKPPYRDIRHTLCGVESMARWERTKDTGRHNTLYFANFNQIARVWMKIVCSVLLPAKHLTEGMPIDVGAILRQNMMKFRNNMRWHFCYGGLITRFLRAQGIKEEAMDMTIAFHPDLMERQLRDDSVMARMFGMAELQLRIGGRPITDEDMENLVDRYPLTESVASLCRIDLAFLEPLDDDEATADEVMDDDNEEEANALMVFDSGDDEAQRPEEVFLTLYFSLTVH
ncbi:hypothetical protein KY290_011081 [Solanum tuberosum]|uniref:Putative plant transposon protein domain-containing protein n=1 Tax=Solanum tuberosum TaxID=4113 RepID=A0ABQ7VZM0_SOLTU|nr:hypothetical protein KY290_011081 [Solanum tuberosum]